MTALQPLIGSRILTLREQRVVFDADLATEQGLAMLSSVLCSARAIAVPRRCRSDRNASTMAHSSIDIALDFEGVYRE